MFDGPINMITNYIIRPKRSKYTLEQLSPNWFQFDRKYYIREDFKIDHIINSQKLQNSQKNQQKISQQDKMKIAGSIFMQSSSRDKLYKKPCVLYLHGNVGSRMSIIPEIEVCFKLNFTVVCFDFIGCGLSDGEYITLGFQQKYQIDSVVKFLNEKYKIQSIILNGRSMGAASALFYYEHFKPKTITGIILDSPYYDVQKLFKSISSEKIKWLPNSIIQWVSQKIRQQILMKTGCDLSTLKLEKKIKTKAPILIFYATKDQIIDQSQVNELFNLIQGKKKFKIIADEQHNTIRSEVERIEAYKWLLENKF